jgi:predicted DCC family thiol-disulfide oxidoreductase YuxK
MTAGGGGPAGGHPVLFYDDRCGFCSATVRFVLKHETAHDLRFASVHGPLAARVLGSAGPGSADSVVWYDPMDHSVRVRSDATLEIARYLGGAWRVAAIGGVVPRFIRDGLYDLVARHRHRLSFADDECLVPPVDVRSRFLG